MRRGAVAEHLPGALVRLPTWEATERAVLLRLPGVGRFLADATGDVVVEPAPGASDADLECFERGPLAAAVLLLSGRLALRAATVVIGGRAVAICGTGAAGASTLAAALALRGHGVLADSVTEVDGTIVRGAAQPCALHLWPDVWETLGLDGGTGDVVRPSLAKRAFRLGPHAPDDAPLGLVVVLRASGRATQPELAPVTGIAKAQVLFGHEWHGRLVGPLGLARRRLEWLTGLGAVTMVRIERPRRWNRPDVLADLVEGASA